ncbi:hypothetical protein RP726_03395 [Candidatus Methylospira mobilis]|uniref:hypothetical protein n=1 Tax=Candidatus Methylospira mobilis TaxID=1808979 RepID=UPI001293B194|nr:hypothetical protein [Candidatus Methylospira mobilis]WNV05467.1 hypothetical protein RP726_03395 [Candidatus Methylospira mobilis]
MNSSTSESIRLIKQDAVRFDGEKTASPRLKVQCCGPMIVQAGKLKIAKARGARWA